MRLNGARSHPKAHMPTIKIACKKCGQRVSGDDRFFGTTVQCPVCSSDIVFPPKSEVDAGAVDDPLSNLPSAMDDIDAAGLPTAPRPTHPAAGGDVSPQPYQRSEDPAPQQHQSQQHEQPQQQPAPVQQQQYQPPPQQQQVPYQQPMPGQQLPGGPLGQPGLPQQPGMPAGGLVTQGMPMPAPYGAVTVQPGQQMVAGGPAPVQVQHPDQAADASKSGIMPLLTLIAGIAALLTCSGVIVGPAAIIMGHLTLIRVDNDDKPGKMKTTIGLILGYASLIFLLLGIVVWKLVSGAQAADA